ncbi:tRNA-specific adenosine deaminase [Blattabacterium sp. (Nauphoeta cinerea)]|uniref:nucleoside deaminase n=1 Tax=Blattabacterium sp. (Nauphoeta cinerea) TaxID=1316444 RepID=UPI0003B0DD35|nr:nucleoside deaminase [Blattabacterium sp. (Nauphoeta cinerea)]AGW86247.1 tRNA-specific adenosine deaminase [Blattabacterium sp. (Nauphoeta cinerea)]
MSLDFDFMKIALKEAFIAFHKNEIPIGAAITYQNMVIATAHNLTETLCNITAHAEMLVINLASDYFKKKYIKKCTLYVTLEPCVMCAGALFWSQIGRVVCGATNPSKRGFLCSGVKLHPKTEFVSGIMKNQCKAIIQEFFFYKRICKHKFKKFR